MGKVQIIGHKQDGSTEVRGEWTLEPCLATLYQITEAIPADSYKSWKNSTDAESIKKGTTFHEKKTYTPDEWDGIGDFMQTKSFVTSEQNTVFKAAKPVR